MKNMQLKDILIAILCTALWGGNFAVMKIAMVQIPPLFLAGMRLGVVGLILMGFVKMPRGHFWQLFLLSITLYGLNFACMVTGLHQMDAGLAAIITELEVPFSVILAALLLKDKMNVMQIAGLGVAFLGAYFVCNTPKIAGNLTPVFLIIAATLAYSCSNIQIKWIPKVDALAMVVYASLFASPQLFLASAFFETNQLHALMTINWHAALAFLYTISMATFAFFIWTRLIKIYSVNQVVPFGLLIPLFGVLFGVILLHEEITLKIILGGLITVLGVWLVLYKPRGLNTVTQ